MKILLELSDEIPNSFGNAVELKTQFIVNKSSYFRVKLKRIKFGLYTEPDLDHT